MKKIVLAAVAALGLSGAANAGTLEICNPEAWYEVSVYAYTDSENFHQYQAPPGKCVYLDRNSFWKAIWSVGFGGLGAGDVRVPSGEGVTTTIRFHGTIFNAWCTSHGHQLLDYERSSGQCPRG